MEQQHEEFMRMAIRLSEQNVLDSLGGPFGAVFVKEGKPIAQSANKVTATNDPTAHAEVMAIRMACTELQTFDLSGCVIDTPFILPTPKQMPVISDLKISLFTMSWSGQWKKECCRFNNC